MEGEDVDRHEMLSDENVLSPERLMMQEDLIEDVGRVGQPTGGPRANRHEATVWIWQSAPFEVRRNSTETESESGDAGPQF